MVLDLAIPEVCKAELIQFAWLRNLRIEVVYPPVLTGLNGRSCDERHYHYAKPPTKHDVRSSVRLRRRWIVITHAVIVKSKE